MHLITGSIFALIYADGFEYMAYQAGWLIGVGFSIIYTSSTNIRYYRPGYFWLIAPDVIISWLIGVPEAWAISQVHELTTLGGKQ